jgi:hypothetical protein
VKDDPFRDLDEEELFECLNIAFRAEDHEAKKGDLPACVTGYHFLAGQHRLLS